MAGSEEPNINFGSPAIFYDSHPDQQEGFIGGYWSWFKAHLYVAWSGEPPKRLWPGTLRLIWWTTDNVQGLRDYELHQHALIKLQYDSLCTIPDVRRCMIMGYSGQNPYTLTYGHNPWQDMFAKQRRQDNAKWLSEEERSKRRAERQKRLEAQGEKVEGGGVGRRIDEVILGNEESETQRLLGSFDGDGDAV